MQQHTKESIVALLETNDLALARAILALNERQTADERASEHTRVVNGRGFNKHDAPFLTSIAKALPRWNSHMTPRQIARARPMVKKYWRQLLEIAQENAQRATAAAAPAEPEITGFGRFG